jgi:hypothetical protein
MMTQEARDKFIEYIKWYNRQGCDELTDIQKAHLKQLRDKWADVPKDADQSQETLDKLMEMKLDHSYINSRVGQDPLWEDYVKTALECRVHMLKCLHMAAMKLKTCKACNKTLDKETHFYKAGKGMHSYQSRCKSCHNKWSIELAQIRRIKNPKPKRPAKKCVRKNGWVLLDDDVKAEILGLRQSGATLAYIGEKYGIHPATLSYWKRKGIMIAAQNSQDDDGEKTDE